MRGNSGSIRAHSASGTSHGFALIGTSRTLTTGADGLRYHRAGPFIQLEVLRPAPIENAVWQSGLFTNQVPACKLRDQETIGYLEQAFGLDSDGADAAATP